MCGTAAANRDTTRRSPGAPNGRDRTLSDAGIPADLRDCGEHVQHERFADFVATPPLRGIGASVDLLRKILDASPDRGESAQARDLLDRALQNPVGTNEPLDDIQGLAPTGTSKDYALQRLERDAPELHAGHGESSMKLSRAPWCGPARSATTWVFGDANEKPPRVGAGWPAGAGNLACIRKVGLIGVMAGVLRRGQGPHG